MRFSPGCRKRFTPATPTNAGSKRRPLLGSGRNTIDYSAGLDAMYVDKLDGRLDAAFFDKMAAEWRAEQARCQCEIDRHQEADKSYMDEGVQILELARNAQRLFERQQPRQKRRLLNFVLSNCTWEDGEVVATFRQPFDLLIETTGVAQQVVGDGRRNLTKSEVWLPGTDSNHRPTG